MLWWETWLCSAVVGVAGRTGVRPDPSHGRRGPLTHHPGHSGLAHPNYNPIIIPLLSCLTTTNTILCPAESVLELEISTSDSDYEAQGLLNRNVQYDPTRSKSGIYLLNFKCCSSKIYAPEFQRPWLLGMAQTLFILFGLVLSSGYPRWEQSVDYCLLWTLSLFRKM